MGSIGSREDPMNVPFDDWGKEISSQAIYDENGDIIGFIDDRTIYESEHRITPITKQEAVNFALSFWGGKVMGSVGSAAANRGSISTTDFQPVVQGDTGNNAPIEYDSNRGKTYRISSGGITRARSAIAETVGASMFTGGKATVSIKRESAIDTVYSLKDKNGTEVGVYTESHTGKRGVGKLTIYQRKRRT